jgi:hypothetical protein
MPVRTLRSAVLGAALTVGPALAIAGPAHAAHAAQVLIASCNATVSGSFSTPLDPGGSDAAQSETLSQNGTVTCFDAGGGLLVSGTATRTTVIPAAQCTGISTPGSSVFRVSWGDGTVSTFDLGQATLIAVDGTASVAAASTVTSDSTKFAGASIDAGVMSSGSGCRTAAGQSSVDSTVVFTLAR